MRIGGGMSRTPDTLYSLHNLAQLYRDVGRTIEAESCYRRALAGRRQALGLNHRQTNLTLKELAELLVTQQRYTEAEPFALDLVERHLQSAHTTPDESQTALELIVSLYESWGNLEKADEYRQKLADLP
jgi:tetratricopeptide (TPR) repeat protein